MLRLTMISVNTPSIIPSIALWIARHSDSSKTNWIRYLVIGNSGCGKTTVIFNLLLQPNWLDYNHLYVLIKSLHQKEYKVLQKGFEAGLSKQQISNVYANQETLRVENISPLTAIDTFSGARNGKIKADFYDNWKNIPDPSALDPMQKNRQNFNRFYFPVNCK